MAALIARDGYLDGPENRRGAASYWSTLRAPYKRWDPSRNRYLNLGYKNQIIPLTRVFRGNGPGKKDSMIAKSSAGELMSCAAVETLDASAEGQSLRSVDFELTLRASEEVPSGVIGEARSRERSLMDRDARVITVPSDDAGQALEIARVLFPERDFSGVKSVRVGTANGVTLYELLNERGAGVAKVLSKGLSIARCLR
jgi:hypothetical protein